jgi:hypothetical protein
MPKEIEKSRVIERVRSLEISFIDNFKKKCDQHTTTVD